MLKNKYVKRLILIIVVAYIVFATSVVFHFLYVKQQIYHELHNPDFQVAEDYLKKFIHAEDAKVYDKRGNDMTNQELPFIKEIYSKDGLDILLEYLSDKNYTLQYGDFVYEVN